MNEYEYLVEKIEQYAFYHCDKLKDVVLPDADRNGLPCALHGALFIVIRISER